jgi:hypothetical protein
MKNFLAIIMVLVMSSNCKKKVNAVQEPESMAVSKPQLKVKINNTETNCNTCFSSYFSGGIWGINFYFPGTTNGDRLIINFSKKPTIGNYTLIKYGEPSFNYQNDNTYFRGRGVLSITAIDTAFNRTIIKLVATFSCTTDTSFNRYYTITEGQINVNLK